MKGLNAIFTVKWFIFSIFVLLIFILILIPTYGVNPFGDSIKLLDVKLFYSAEDVKDLFSSLGTNGLISYRFFILYIDMIYPLVYGITLIITMGLIKKMVVSNSSRFTSIYLLPVAVMLFDYLENLNTLIMINSFPEIKANNVLFGSLSTGAKWLFLGIIFVILLIAIFTLLFKLIKRLNKQLG